MPNEIVLPALPEPTAWNCQLVMNKTGGIVEGWFTTKSENDPDDIPAGWDARIERLPVFSADQLRTAQRAAAIAGWRAGLEAAAREADAAWNPGPTPAAIRSLPEPEIAGHGVPAHSNMVDSDSERAIEKWLSGNAGVQEVPRG